MEGKKLRSLQILRFAAAAMVVWAHAGYMAHALADRSDWVGPLSSLGSAGVDIFFVISGAIIYLTAFRQPTCSVEFLRKRFLRIAPIYYLIALAWFPLFVLIGNHVDSGTLVASIIFWPAWNGLHGPALQMGWSLCFEVLFYLSVALVLVSRAFVPLILGAYLACWHFAYAAPALQFLGNPISLEFLAGISIAAWSNPNRHFPMWGAAFLIEAGFCLLFILHLPHGLDAPLFTMDGEQSLNRVVMYGIPSTMIVLGCCSIEPYLKGKWIDCAVFLGDASYSVYLIHWPIIELLKIGGPKIDLVLPIWLSWPGAILLGISAGLLVYRYIEKPMNLWFRTRRSYRPRYAP